MKKQLISGACTALALSVLAFGLISGGAVFAQTADQPQAGESDLSALVARQHSRMDMIEDSLKEIRGTVEVELRDIRMQLEQLSASALAGQSGASVDAKQFQSEMTRLGDSIDILSQRISRTLEMTSDVEFRVLRLEKRMQTLLSLSGDDLTQQLAQQDVTAAQAPPAVSIGRDADTGETVWVIEEDKLNAQLEKDTDDQAAGDHAAGDHADQVTPPAQTDQVAEEPAADAAPAIPTYLPVASPEEQYRFALARALQNDLPTAENAFIEFGELHPDHERAADALFWQGRVQFIQTQYEKAATTFSKFNSLYSSDPRIADTTLWIAESVAKFANSEQACAIYGDLSQLVDQPPESFTARLAELSANAGCNS